MIKLTDTVWAQQYYFEKMGIAAIIILAAAVIFLTVLLYRALVKIRNQAAEINMLREIVERLDNNDLMIKSCISPERSRNLWT